MSIEDLKKKKRRKDLGQPQPQTTATTEMVSQGGSVPPAPQGGNTGKSLGTPSSSGSVPDKSPSGTGDVKQSGGQDEPDKKDSDSSENQSVKKSGDDSREKDKHDRNSDKDYDDDKKHDDKDDEDAEKDEKDGDDADGGKEAGDKDADSDDIPDEAEDAAAEGQEAPGQGTEQLGGAADAAQGAEQAEQAGQAASGAAGAAAGAESAAGAGAAAGAAGGAAPVVTPQDVKDIKDLDVKEDAKDLKEDLKDGDLNAVAKNKSLNKAAEVAAKFDPTGTAAAINLGLKVAQQVDLNALKRGDAAGAAKSLGKNMSQNPAAAAGMAGGDADGLSENEGDIRDMDEDDAKPDDEGTSEDEGGEEKDEDDVPPEDEKPASDEEEEDGGDDDKEKEDAEKGKEIAMRSASMAASAAANVAPYVLILKAAYAFAQFLYMMLMSLVQTIAQGVSWLAMLAANIWATIQSVIMWPGTMIANAFGVAMTSVQSTVVGASTFIVVGVLAFAGVSAIQYNAELQTMLSNDKPVTIHTGCTEAQKGFFANLKEVLTGDPVSGLSSQQQRIIEQVMAVLNDPSLPVNQTEHPNSTAYGYGVLGNAYAESGLNPFAIQGNPVKLSLDKIMASDGSIAGSDGKENLKKTHDYVMNEARDGSYTYGIGLFQITYYREQFLDFCYSEDEESKGLTKLDGYVDPLSDGADTDLSKHSSDWYTVGAQMSYMLGYPSSVMFFTKAYDPTALKADGIENVEDIDYKSHITLLNKELTDAELEACRASTLFLGTFERPASYLAGGKDMEDVIYRRANMAVSISRKYKDVDIMAKISENSEWAANVIGRASTMVGVATAGAVADGYTNCGMNTAAWNLDSPAAVAITYSHPEKNEIATTKATTAYAYIVGTIGKKIGDGMANIDYNFASCDRGVAYAYYVSGWDTEMHFGGVDDMRAYLESSERWETVADFKYSEASSEYLHPDVDTAEKRKELLQPGDVLIDYCGSDPGLHVYMYTGNDMVLNVKGITEDDLSQEKYDVYKNKEMVEASWHEYYPCLKNFHLYGSDKSHNETSGGTIVYRCKNPMSDNTYKEIVRYGAPKEEPDAA